MAKNESGSRASPPVVRPPTTDLRIDATPEAVARAVLQGGATPKKKPQPATAE